MLRHKTTLGKGARSSVLLLETEEKPVPPLRALPHPHGLPAKRPSGGVGLLPLPKPARLLRQWELKPHSVPHFSHQGVVWLGVTLQKSPWMHTALQACSVRRGGSTASKTQEIKEESVPGWPSTVSERALASADSFEKCQSFLLPSQRALRSTAPGLGDLLPSTTSHLGHNKGSLLSIAAKVIEKGEGSS